MDWLTLLGIAIGLAMDAFAVAVGVSTVLKTVSRRQYFRLAWHFGLFQALMPLLGWLLGRMAAGILEAFDHWIAFTILSILGIKMILEAWKPAEDKKMPLDPTRGMSLMLLSVATSIDAFAAGLSLALLGSEIFTAAAVIGIVACIMTLVGMRFGSALGKRVGSGAEVFGGVVLILLGFKILLDHLAG